MRAGDRRIAENQVVFGPAPDGKLRTPHRYAGLLPAFRRQDQRKAGGDEGVDQLLGPDVAEQVAILRRMDVDILKQGEGDRLRLGGFLHDFLQPRLVVVIALLPGRVLALEKNQLPVQKITERQCRGFVDHEQRVPLQLTQMLQQTVQLHDGRRRLKTGRFLRQHQQALDQNRVRLPHAHPGVVRVVQEPEKAAQRDRMESPVVPPGRRVELFLHDEQVEMMARGDHDVHHAHEGLVVGVHLPQVLLKRFLLIGPFGDDRVRERKTGGHSRHFFKLFQ